MSLEMNANLTKLNGLAATAVRHENLSGEDSVIHASPMDALNTTGCLQARCEALQNVRIALNPELRGVKDDTVSNLSLIDGFGKIVQSLQTKETVLVDYEKAVDLYVAKMAKGGKPGETKLGADLPGLGGKNDRVEITREYLTKPEVAETIKNIFCVFN